MKLARFFDKFDQLADAPNAVEKLRELVLRMATSGRIADQDPSDQPASELLREIFAIRDRLIKKGLARSRVEGNMIVAGDTIDVPASWSRCMISEVCDLQTGATPSRQESTYFGGNTPWLVSGDINRGEIFECDGRITESGLKNSNCKIIPKDSVLIALNGQGKTRATVALLRIEAALNQSLVAMIPYSRERLLPEYLFWNLRGRYYSIRDITGQDQRRGLNMKLVGQLSLPIPPLAEQKRIVAKVDELMALCDRLEAQQQERDTRHATLARASLARFAEAPTPANLDFLFHNSYTITPADLRKSILTLAVQGKLVPHDSQSAGWEARSLKELTTKIGSGSTPSGGKESYHQSGVPLIRSMNVHFGGFVREGLVFLNKEQAEKLKNVTVETNDVLLNITGASIGRVTIAPKDMAGARVNQHVCIVRPTAEILPRFLETFLASPVVQDLIDDVQVGATREALTKAMIEQFEIPVPSLAEQRRIVAKVDQLMALVDQLETQLTASRATAEKLMEAVVAELVKSEPSAVSTPVSDDKPAQSNLVPISSRRSAKKNVSDAFVEAIVIAQLTRGLASLEFPLGRMRYNKLAYLAHRKVDDDVTQRYLKKAAGPYSPWSKYGGPEKIALKNGYIKNAKSGNYEGWIPGERVGDIDLYLPNYPVCSAVSWVVAKLHYKKKEELELLATVDFAALDLRTRGRDVTRETIKWIIATDKEWAPKLNRDIFSDENIEKALADLSGLFPSSYS